MTEEIFQVTKIMSNIKNHDFSVSDLKITKAESELIYKYLAKKRNELMFDEQFKDPIV